MLLITCLIVKTLKKSIETTPKREATTRGKISKAPNEITDKKISIEDAKSSIGTIEGFECCQTLMEHSKQSGDGLTMLLYEILKSKSTEREGLLKEFLQI